MKDIVTVGEVLIDLTQTGLTEQGIPVYAANPGGAPANLAVAASKLGADTAFIGKVGRDSLGAFLKSVLMSNGVDVSGVLEDAHGHTTLAVVSLDSTGERSFCFYREADTHLSEDDLSAELIKNAKFLHIGSVSLTAEPSRSATLKAAGIARDNGVYVSYDPNYRPDLWPDKTTAVKEMRSVLPFTDVLKISDEELPLMTGTDDLISGTAALRDMGITLIFVTMGAKGAFYRYGDATGEVAGVPCQVGDTNGAGDTFFGAALSRLAKNDLKALAIPELEDIIAFANKAASVTTSRHGAIPAMPTLEEL